MFIEANFTLEYRKHFKGLISNFGFGGYSQIVFYRTYSRTTKDGRQETWGDVVVRVIEGVMSIRKDYYLKNRLRWDENHWQKYAHEMAESLFYLNWSPPGRGLWAMGTDLIHERGSMALYNCLFCQIKSNEDFCWMMDSLMYGCGVGYEATNQYKLNILSEAEYRFQVPDTREGWVNALLFLLENPNTVFDYSLIRKEGEPIVTFGGFASGPDPLEDFLETVRCLVRSFQRRRIDKETYEELIEIEQRRLKRGTESAQYEIERLSSLVAHEHVYTSIMFQNDIANLIGKCVVTGNVRRSAELSVGDPHDVEYAQLKNYDVYPYRMSWGWMSNNSIFLSQPEHFEKMQHIAYQNINGRDLGLLNRVNFPKGRIGKNDNLREDKGVGLNPCGEIILESYESCNVVETYPTRCQDTDVWLRACEFATFYASTIALLPTHSELTNGVVFNNRRIGVSIVDYTGWKHYEGLNRVIRDMRKGYKRVRETNRYLAKQAGVPESIRVTTVKPGGTVPKLAGRTSGIGHPTFDYMIRRTRVQESHPICKVLIDSGLPYERDTYTDQTLCFEYPLHCGPAKPATEVSLWEQAMNLVTVQREWADNAVSNTLYFNKDEHQQIEHVLSAIAPLIKSLSLLPHTEQGAFAQMPEEGITQQEYIKRVDALQAIDWSEYSGGDGVDEKYCDGDTCAI